MIICINNLAVSMSVGVHDWEKHIPQTLLIDVKLLCDVAHAALSDNIDDTVDYDKLSQCIIHQLKERHYHLIEHVAESVATLCLKQPKVLEATITIQKPDAIAYASSVSVKLKKVRNIYP